MHRVIDEILAAERELSLGVQQLPAADRDRLRERIFTRYGRRSLRLWEVAQGCASVQSPEGWSWNHEFVGPRNCVLLFDVEEEAEMFSVPSGSAFHELLGSTCHFEFYVTDADASYLICFNHHDFLVCCGSARHWLERRSEKKAG